MVSLHTMGCNHIKYFIILKYENVIENQNLLWLMMANVELNINEIKKNATCLTPM